MAYDFETFLARHGEIGAQAILETLERREGVRSLSTTPLADRWAIMMRDMSSQNHCNQRQAA